MPPASPSEPMEEDEPSVYLTGDTSAALLLRNRRDTGLLTFGTRNWRGLGLWRVKLERDNAY